MTVSSLHKKKILNEVGVFYQKIDLNDTTDKKGLILFFNQEEIKCINVLDNGTTEDIEIVEAKYATDFNMRNHGIIDESVLQERTVTIIGLGSGGSPTVLDLVRCGVVNFNLIDFDTVNLSNLCRSVYDLTDIGRNKTEAIVEKVLDINPFVNINIYEEDILEMNHEKLLKIIDSSDLIIEATDNVKSKILINGLAYHSKAVLYPSVYDLGKGGDVLITMPGLPCFECVFRSIMNQMKEVKKGDWDYSTGQAKPMPALIADIQIVVARSVKLALAILTADEEDSLFDKITEPGCSILFIGNEKNTFIFEKPFQEVWAETEIDPNCSCQSLM